MQGMETRELAVNFIKSLPYSDREHVKEMLSHGVTCGADYARKNGIEPAVFSNELKAIFGGH